MLIKVMKVMSLLTNFNLQKMLEGVDFKNICQQYVVQLGVLFLAEIYTHIRNSNNRMDDNNIIELLADFREGFDQRLQLIVINHILCEYYYINMVKLLYEFCLIKSFSKSE